jgi:hypothetical protein
MSEKQEKKHEYPESNKDPQADNEAMEYEYDQD